MKLAFSEKIFLKIGRRFYFWTLILILSCIIFLGREAEAQSRLITLVLPSSEAGSGFVDSILSGVRNFERHSETYRVEVVELPVGADTATSGAIIDAAASSESEAVFLVGAQLQTQLERIAELYPEKKFIMFAASVDAPNVQSILLSYEQGAFLVGAIAAAASDAGSVGFVGGMDTVAIRRYACGFRLGANWLSTGTDVLAELAGTTSSAFTDPELGRRLALDLHARGADIIFHAAGATGDGVIAAAREAGFLAIGVDVNQNGVAPGHVLTSLVVRADVAVSVALQSFAEGRWSPGVEEFGFHEGAFQLSMDDNNMNLFDENLLETRNRATDWLVHNFFYLSDIAQNNCVGKINASP